MLKTVVCNNIRLKVGEGGGYAVGQLVEALHYQPEGCGFDSHWGLWDF